MADFTSSIYSLVVLSTASLGAVTYFDNLYENKFLGGMERLKESWQRFSDRIPDNILGDEKFESLNKDYDRLINQKLESLTFMQTRVLLALILPYAALGQIANIFIKIGWTHQYLEITHAIILAIVYLALTVILVKIGRGLLRKKEKIEAFAGAVETHISKIDLVDAIFPFDNNIGAAAKKAPAKRAAAKKAPAKKAPAKKAPAKKAAAKKAARNKTSR